MKIKIYIYLSQSLASLFNMAEMIHCAFSVDLFKYLPHTKFQPEKGCFQWQPKCSAGILELI